MSPVYFNCRSLIFSLCLFFFNTACTTLSRPFYYKVTKGNQTSHVLGTMHMGFGINELPGFVLDDFNRANSYADELYYGLEIESETGDQNDNKVSAIDHKMKKYRQQAIVDNILSKNDIRNKIKPERWAILYKKIMENIALAKIEVDSEFKEDWTPYLTPAMVYAMSRPVKAGVIYLPHEMVYGLSQRMDEQFNKIAREKSKIFIELDTEFAEFMKCLDEVYLNLLNTENLDVGVSSDDFKSLYRAYQLGDEDYILALLNNGVVQNNKCVLENRNKLWAENLDKKFEHYSPIFVAVGAAHLIGPNSLLDYLKKNGYRVERVTNK